MIKKYFKIVLAFLITTAIMGVFNFIAQIVFIFLDLVSRWESSSALILVLWIVTGVFAAIYTEAVAGLLMEKKDITYRIVYTPVLIVSIAAMVVASILMFQEGFTSDPSEFTLLLNNGLNFISYFFGAAGMSLIGRKL
jgi:hypothetical protein